MNNENDGGDKNKIFGVVVVLGLFVALAFTIIYAGRGTTAAVVAGTSGSAGASDGGDHSTDGFSSYDEMMKAHHPEGAGGSSGSDGCGGVPSSGGHDSPFVGSGEKSEYGITYDNAGYEQLLAMSNSITLNGGQTQKIVGLDITLPCCGVRTLQASSNCECGHHVAMFGLAKLMISKEYSREEIQAELDKWKQIFYPEGGSANTGGC
ncbi:MAG: hypothetical protein HY363_00695 [Candidatus Aenigmarchaeota archaeon]|nr:hypothetical protein [Candidatus Aenigmarchaeota archaeon]